MKRIFLPTMDEEKVANEIGDYVVNLCLSRHATGCVIGLSGGVDSTATAALIKRGFDRFRDRSFRSELSLVGYILPTKINPLEDKLDGEKVAQRLSIDYETIELDGIVKAYESTNPEAFVNQYDRGNLISRIRGNVLSTKAATQNKILAGTGNKDEDLHIGYYTLFGDGAVHFSPIGNLSKRLVKQMACYLGFKDLAYREPSAGLEVGQTDFRDLGYSYDLVELIGEGLAQGFSNRQLINHPQVVETVLKDIEHYRTAFGSEKFSSAKEMVRDIERRHVIALGKASILHPPTIPVTLEYGGVI